MAQAKDLTAGGTEVAGVLAFPVFLAGKERLTVRESERC